MATAREMYEVVRSMRWAAAVKLPVSATQTKARMLKRMSMEGPGPGGMRILSRSVSGIMADSVHNASSIRRLILGLAPL
ncbi:hypothetical protein D9M68_863390 [compost metagenome]